MTLPLRDLGTSKSCKGLYSRKRVHVVVADRRDVNHQGSRLQRNQGFRRCFLGTNHASYKNVVLLKSMQTIRVVVEDGIQLRD